MGFHHGDKWLKEYERNLQLLKGETIKDVNYKNTHAIVSTESGKKIIFRSDLNTTLSINEIK